MRDCVFGPWDPDTGRRQVIELADPVERDARGHGGQRDPLLPPRRGDPGARPGRPGRHLCLRAAPGNFSRCSSPRTAAPCSAYEDDMDHRGTHALIAARALLTIAADGDDAPIHEHIDAYADNPALL